MRNNNFGLKTKKIISGTKKNEPDPAIRICLLGDVRTRPNFGHIARFVSRNDFVALFPDGSPCFFFHGGSKATLKAKKTTYQNNYLLVTLLQELPLTPRLDPRCGHLTDFDSVRFSMGRHGGCFTLDFCRFRIDVAGFLACGFAFISLLSTRHFQKTSPSEQGSFCFLLSEIMPFMFHQFYHIE